MEVQKRQQIDEAIKIQASTAEISDMVAYLKTCTPNPAHPFHSQFMAILNKLDDISK